MRIGDWSLDVCSSDLKDRKAILAKGACAYCGSASGPFHIDHVKPFSRGGSNHRSNLKLACRDCNLSKSNKPLSKWRRSEEHTSELQSLMRNSYAVFCLKKKKKI